MRPYEKYVSSNVDWIANIPEKWKIKKLKYITFLRKQKTDDTQLSYLALEHIESRTGRIVKPQDDEVQPEGESLKFYKGDVLFCKLRPYLAKCVVASDKGKCTPELLVINSSRQIVEKFLFYSMLSYGFISLVNSSTYGSKMPRASWEYIGGMQIPIPNIVTQQAVVGYLDRETARIDNIIQTKEMLIERLKEKRTALITYAVTKGIDPNVKMKSSGIEWIGEIPEEWKVKKIKYIVGTKVTDGPHTTPDLVPYGIPFVSAEAVKNNRINLELIRGYISEEDHQEFCKKCKPQKGDIFMVKSGATTGNIAIVDFDTEFSIWSPLALIRSKENEYEQKFVFYSMLSDFFVKQVTISWSFGTQQNIGMGVIENLIIFAPPKKTQSKIVDFLDTEVSRINAMIGKTVISIEKLKEYRFALISACVTGKVDVRSV